MSYDRVKQAWEGTGTDTMALGTDAPTGFRRLADIVPDGGQFDYAIVDQSASQWEIGTGIYSSSAGTLTRQKIYASSTGGSKVDFAAGTKYIFGTIPGTKWILSNLTLCVSSAGSDTTGDGTSGAPWATVNKALCWLADKWISTNAVVTIAIGDGALNISSPITVDHPCGGQINIAGQNTYSVNMTSVQSSSGTAGAWSVVINLSDVSHIANDDYVNIIAATGGTRPEMIEGCWAVTNVDSANSRITVATTNHYLAAPSGAVSASVLVLKARIVATNCSGFVINGPLGLLDKLAIVGDGAAGRAGLDLLFNVSTRACSLVLGDVGFNHWSTGIASWGTNRVTATPTSRPCVGNCTTGIHSSFASAVMLPNGSTVAGCSVGLLASYMGTIYLSTGTVTGCSTYGLRASSVGMNQVYSGKLTGNSVGAYASGKGYNYLGAASFSSNATDMSPAANYDGNEGGFNDT